MLQEINLVWRNPYSQRVVEILHYFYQGDVKRFLVIQEDKVKELCTTYQDLANREKKAARFQTASVERNPGGRYTQWRVVFKGFMRLLQDWFKPVIDGRLRKRRKEIRENKIN